MVPLPVKVACCTSCQARPPDLVYTPEFATAVDPSRERAHTASEIVPAGNQGPCEGCARPTVTSADTTTARKKLRESPLACCGAVIFGDASTKKSVRNNDSRTLFTRFEDSPTIDSREELDRGRLTSKRTAAPRPLERCCWERMLDLIPIHDSHRASKLQPNQPAT